MEASKGLEYAISLGIRLSDTVLSTIEEGPSLIYKHHYKTVNWILDQTAEQIANLLQSAGYSSLAIPASQVVDWKHQGGHFSHRVVARECGLGWIGKSGLLVHHQYGARVRYATVLTDFPLSEDRSQETGECGSCQKCIDACPAGAISEAGYEREKCVAKLKQFAGMRGIGVSICGICVKVCGRRV
ncbi:MAG: epoxyqueuosine reductase [Candidatus Stahlbacteria bacterium]|nr:epoxyqueuosine reductase [Candidatus Stahlbacteria bacterium]